MGLNLMTKPFVIQCFNKLHTIIIIKHFKICYIKEQMNCNVTLDIAS